MNENDAHNYSSRKHFILDLPLKNEFNLLHPEQILLKFGGVVRDFGSLCYTRRSKKPRTKLQPRLVDVTSFNSNRRSVIARGVVVISKYMVGKRPITLRDYIQTFIWFVDWADSNDFQNCLENSELAEIALFHYFKFIDECHRRGELKTIRARNSQTYVLVLLKLIFNDNEFGRNLHLIRDIDKDKNGTDPARPDDFAHNIALVQMLFDGLYELIIKKKPFPYKLSLPDSLNWEKGNYLWIFPTKNWFKPPHIKSEFSLRSNVVNNMIFDYENGKVADFESIWKYYTAPSPATKKMKAKRFIQYAQARLENANNVDRHWRRLYFASLAHQAFVYLFLVNTGANLAVLNEIEFKSDIDLDVANQSFRAVKFRAGGKVVSLGVPVSFLPSLKKFMEIRSYQLSTTSFKYMFFQMIANGKKITVNRLTPNSISKMEPFYKLLKKIDPKMIIVKPRQVRATQSEWLLKNYGTSIAAKVMGHSEKTANVNYGRGFASDHKEEITDLLKKISKAARAQKIDISPQTLQKTIKLEQGGSCNNFGKPESLLDDDLIQVTCNGGCWFCSNRCLIANEEDTRKIASAIFLMEQVITSQSQEAELRPLIAKCEADLLRISEVKGCSEMVDRVKKEVFQQGILTSFWTRKFYMFRMLGVIV